MMPPNTSPVNFRPGRFRLPPTFKLWPDMAQAGDIGAPVATTPPLPSALRMWPDQFPALLGPAFPETPPIPPTVASGDLITAVHENTVTEGINDLWIDLQWLAANALTNPTTAKGDLIVNNGSVLARVPLGTNAQVLTADSTLPLGVKWATPTASGSFVPTTRQVIAGAGMTGGGALSADVTLNANVTSVFGRTGAVVITSAEIAAVQTPWLQNINGAGFTLFNALGIGIGVNAAANVPANTLWVNSPVRSQIVAVFSCNDGVTANLQAPGIGFGPNSGQHFAAIYGYQAFGNTYGEGHLFFQTRTNDALAERMRITNAGVVGIGNPGIPPSVVSSAFTYLVVGSSTAAVGGQLNLICNATTATVGSISGGNLAITAADKRIAAINFAIDGPINSGAMAFYTWNAGVVGERLRITNVGVVSINRSTPHNDPAHPFQVHVATDANFFVGSFGGTTVGVQALNDATATWVNMRFQALGVGINKEPAGYALDVEGSVNVTGGYYVNGVLLTAGGGGGSQTPWTQNIEAAGFGISNIGYAHFKPKTAGDLVIQFQDGVPSTTTVLRQSASLVKFSNNAANIEFDANTNGGIVNQLVLAGSGNVGIHTGAPNYLLSLGSALGDKLAIYDGGVGPSAIYGFGIQSYQLQMYAPNAATARVSIGFGNSATFGEILTVNQNGCVGIGYSGANDALVIQGLPGAGQGQLRIAYGNYGVFFRSDGASFYCMVTASGDPYGTWSATIPWSFNLANKNMTINYLITGSSTLQGTTTINGAVSSSAHIVAYSTNVGTSFSYSAIEIRETNLVANTQLGIEYSPRIGFHWGSQVACAIGMDAAGTIRTFDNPGTNYAAFACASLTANGHISASDYIAFNNVIYGNSKAVMETSDSVYVRLNQSSQFSAGIWLGTSFLGMSSGLLAIGSVGGSGAINISANNSADAGNRITINGNPTANSWFFTGGNFGINTNAPSSFLSILGAPGSLATTNQQVSIGETGNNPDYRMTLSYLVLNGAWMSAIQSWAGNAPNHLLLNPRGGRIGIGTDLPRGLVSICPVQGNATSVNDAITLLVGEATNTAGHYTAHGMFHDGVNWNHSINAWTGGAGGILLLNAAGGRVRVGSAAAPGYMLDVAGEVNATGLRVNGVPVSGGGGYSGPTTQNVATGIAALGGVYRNNSGKAMWVAVALFLSAGTSGTAYTDANSSAPTQLAAYVTAPNTAACYDTLNFTVLPGNYYRVLGNGVPAPTIQSWLEWY